MFCNNTKSLANKTINFVNESHLFLLVKLQLRPTRQRHENRPYMLQSFVFKTCKMVYKPSCMHDGTMVFDAHDVFFAFTVIWAWWTVVRFVFYAPTKNTNLCFTNNFMKDLYSIHKHEACTFQMFQNFNEKVKQ